MPLFISSTASSYIPSIQSSHLPISEALRHPLLIIRHQTQSPPLKTSKNHASSEANSPIPDIPTSPPTIFTSASFPSHLTLVLSKPSAAHPKTCFSVSLAPST